MMRRGDSRRQAAPGRGGGGMAERARRAAEGMMPRPRRTRAGRRQQQGEATGSTRKGEGRHADAGGGSGVGERKGPPGAARGSHEESPGNARAGSREHGASARPVTRGLSSWWHRARALESRKSGGVLGQRTQDRLSEIKVLVLSPLHYKVGRRVPPVPMPMDAIFPKHHILFILRY